MSEEKPTDMFSHSPETRLVSVINVSFTEKRTEENPETRQLSHLNRHWSHDKLSLSKLYVATHAEVCNNVTTMFELDWIKKKLAQNVDIQHRCSLRFQSACDFEIRLRLSKLGGKCHPQWRFHQMESKRSRIDPVKSLTLTFLPLRASRLLKHSWLHRQAHVIFYVSKTKISCRKFTITEIDSNNCSCQQDKINCRKLTNIETDSTYFVCQ